jgi:peptidoglycan/LPS O-acetylase OafA/YrhL
LSLPRSAVDTPAEPAGSAAQDAVAPAPRTYGEGSVALARIRGLDGIRGVFVTAVVIGHVGFLLSAHRGATHIFNSPGFVVGVDVFFVLSGALITSLLLIEYETTSDISLRDFYVRRARRLAPAFIIAILAGICLSALAIKPGLGRHPATSVIAIVLFLSNMVPKSHGGIGVLAPAWSLAIEEQFYATWPATLRMLLRGKTSTNALLVIAGSGMLICVGLTTWVASAIDDSAAYYLSFRGGIGLLLGVCMGIMLVRRPESKVLKIFWPSWVAIGSCVALFGLAASIHGTARGGELAFPLGGPSYLFIDLAAAGLVGHVFVRRQVDSIVTRFLSLQVWIGLGIISYGIYLFHVPVIVVCIRLMKGVPPNLIMVIAPLITVALATLSYFFIERPIRRGRRRRRAQRAPESTPA